ncbi:MAG: type II toxin-antitoxin system HicA family toxin [Methylococcales bacterium]
MNSAEFIRLLQDDGWVLRSVKDSHRVFTHPTKPGRISVPHPRKDLGTGLTHKLMKLAKLK